MRMVRLGLVIIVAGLTLMVSACRTAEPGVKSTQFSQYTRMEVGTAKGTEAAEAVLKDLGLKNVEASSTNLDGWAKGWMADKTLVKVSLDRLSDDASEISVMVGSFGDPDLGKEIIARVRRHLGIEPPPPPATRPATTQRVN